MVERRGGGIRELQLLKLQVAPLEQEEKKDIFPFADPGQLICFMSDSGIPECHNT